MSVHVASYDHPNPDSELDLQFLRVTVVDGTQLILPQVVSAVVPQFAPYDIDFEGSITGYIAFVSQAPSIPGVMASARFFEGADSYQVACDYVDGIPVGSLMIIDELQNYFPDAGRKPLSPGVTKFVAEHGHKGLDIVFMGQDLKDCHKIWRRRVDTKINFTKLDMVGAGNHYNWSLSKATGPEKFKHVSSGKTPYNKKIFGSYKSFEKGAETAQRYADSRQSIWSNPVFKKWIPLFLVVFCVSVYYVYNAFKGGGLEKSLMGKHGASTPSMSASYQGNGGPAQAAPAAPVPEKKYEKDFIQDLSERYRLRLSMVVRNKEKMSAVFEWFDDGLRAVERLTMKQIIDLGYMVIVSPDLDTATISKGKVSYVATQFPLEGWARVSDARQREIAGGDRVADAGGVSGVSGGGSGPSVVSFDEDGYGVLGKKTGKAVGSK
ncbi:zona occludens toxin [Collimonas sp. OK607]|uniref:zonular occludens toxin domain-containing protein n=1 Tax=Collimonas sp. OK607 TaxID=1798194 RepID=UPI0008E1EC4F|nr:zonular occludens toxin domain-containing protein [Collimonas sp. OK607]SFA98722.1 zona occludens toxin [Collimonas sp. OK607]